MFLIQILTYVVRYVNFTVMLHINFYKTVITIKILSKTAMSCKKAKKASSEGEERKGAKENAQPTRKVAQLNTEKMEKYIRSIDSKQTDFYINPR